MAVSPDPSRPMPESRPLLEGRKVLVTGAASGIGRATAMVLRREGASLALIDRDRNGLEVVATELGAEPILLDLSQPEKIEAAVMRSGELLDGLDGVVNCAGIGAPTAIEDTDAATLARFLAINLVAPFLVCRAALPLLRQANGATIVNIASAQGLLPNMPRNTAYAASKGGLIAFTKSLAAEVGPKVRANAICPGLVATPMTQFLLEDGPPPEDAPFLQQYALRRMGQPHEVAEAVLFLTSARSSLITGVALAVDAGRSFH